MKIENFKWNKFLAVAFAVATAASVQAQAIDFDVAKGSLTIPEIKIGAASLYNVVLRFDADGRFTPTSYSPTPPATTPALSTFKGIRMDSLTFTRNTDTGLCTDAVLTFTNTNSTAKSPVLNFDLVVGGITQRQFTFTSQGMAPNAKAQGSVLLFDSATAKYPACGSFVLQFNEFASFVF